MFNIFIIFVDDYKRALDKIIKGDITSTASEGEANSPNPAYMRTKRRSSPCKNEGNQTESLPRPSTANSKLYCRQSPRLITAKRKLELQFKSPGNLEVGI